MSERMDAAAERIGMNEAFAFSYGYDAGRNAGLDDAIQAAADSDLPLAQRKAVIATIRAMKLPVSEVSHG